MDLGVVRCPGQARKQRKDGCFGARRGTFSRRAAIGSHPRPEQKGGGRTSPALKTKKAPLRRVVTEGTYREDGHGAPAGKAGRPRTLVCGKGLKHCECLGRPDKFKRKKKWWVSPFTQHLNEENDSQLWGKPKRIHSYPSSHRKWGKHKNKKRSESGPGSSQKIEAVKLKPKTS